MMTRYLCTGLLCCFPTALLNAQDAAALLEKSRQATTLEQPSGPSFHLRAEFHTFDYKGVPDGDGTVDEIFEHGGRWKRTILYRGQQATQVFPGTGMTLSLTGTDFEPSFAEQGVISMLLAPVPSADKMKSMTLTTTPFKTGALTLTCVIAALPYKSESNTKATAPNEVYCIAPDSGLVRTVQAHDNRIAIVNSFMKINPVYFAKEIVINERGKPRATIHVTSLEASPKIAPDEFTLPGGSASQDAALTLPGSFVAGRVISKPDPVFPDSARQRHVQGTVVLHAIISKNGSISDLELISTPDDSLSDSAMDAVRKWTYQPYMRDGKPIDVNSIITVNYAFSR